MDDYDEEEEEEEEEELKSSRYLMATKTRMSTTMIPGVPRLAPSWPRSSAPWSWRRGHARQEVSTPQEDEKKEEEEEEDVPLQGADVDVFVAEPQQLFFNDVRQDDDDDDDDDDGDDDEGCGGWGGGIAIKSCSSVVRPSQSRARRGNPPIARCKTPSSVPQVSETVLAVAQDRVRAASAIPSSSRHRRRRRRRRRHRRSPPKTHADQTEERMATARRRRRSGKRHGASDPTG